MNVKTAAAHAGRTTATIYRWIRTGKIEARKTVYGTWAINQASLDAHIATLPAAKPTPALTADNLIQLGHRRWTKAGHDRVYIQNAAALAGLDHETYRSGNISWGALDGQRISNAKTSELLGATSKVYFDVATGQITGAWSTRILDADTITTRITTALLTAVAA